MMQMPLKKQYMIATLVVAVLVVVNIAGFWFFVRPGAPVGTVAGTVSMVSANVLAITDGKQHVRTFILTPDTKIMRGKTVATTTDIAVGMFVMISASSFHSGATATKIRILSTTPFDRHHKPDTP